MGWGLKPECVPALLSTKDESEALILSLRLLVRLLLTAAHAKNESR
jgi:hypothetical protein